MTTTIQLLLGLGITCTIAAIVLPFLPEKRQTTCPYCGTFTACPECSEEMDRIDRERKRRNP